MAELITYLRNDENSSLDVIVNKTKVGEIYKECDGFYVFMFDQTRGLRGYFPEHFFTEISRKLKDSNEDWEQTLENEMTEMQRLDFKVGEV